MIISVDVEKTFDKIQYLFMIITLRKLGIRKNFLRQIQVIYKTYLQLISYFRVKNENFFLKVGNKQRCLLSPCLFSVVLEVLDSAII